MKRTSLNILDDLKEEYRFYTDLKYALRFKIQMLAQPGKSNISEEDRKEFIDTYLRNERVAAILISLESAINAMNTATNEIYQLNNLQ